MQQTISRYSQERELRVDLELVRCADTPGDSPERLAGGTGWEEKTLGEGELRDYLKKALRSNWFLDEVCADGIVCPFFSLPTSSRFSAASPSTFSLCMAPRCRKTM